MANQNSLHLQITAVFHYAFAAYVRSYSKRAVLRKYLSLFPIQSVICQCPTKLSLLPPHAHPVAMAALPADSTVADFLPTRDGRRYSVRYTQNTDHSHAHATGGTHTHHTPYTTRRTSKYEKDGRGRFPARGSRTARLGAHETGRTAIENQSWGCMRGMGEIPLASSSDNVRCTGCLFALVAPIRSGRRWWWRRELVVNDCIRRAVDSRRCQLAGAQPCGKGWAE